jgi:hypothetical protein
MNKRVVAGVVLVSALALAIGCAAWWKSLSKMYISRWNMPNKAPNLKNVGGGNVCIVPGRASSWDQSTCADVHLFPGVYRAIGVEGDRIVKWQDEHGFDSGGVSQSGLLAPGFPVFSSLAWTMIEPVYLSGSQLSDLLIEITQISRKSNDLTVQSALSQLAAMAEKARLESKAILFI